MKSVFEEEVSIELVNRINNLQSDTKRVWGSMSVDQMLAHCCVTYEMLFEDKHSKPNAFMKLILKLFVKEFVVGDKPYPRNGKTAPQFIIKEAKNFEEEKERLIAFILRTQKLGADHFEGKVSHSFGKLTTRQWNNMFYKHLDHHLAQFGV